MKAVNVLCVISLVKFRLLLTISFQISLVETNDELQKVFSEEIVREALIGCGITEPLAQLTLANREEVCTLLCLRDVIIGCKSAIDQFMDGLEEVYKLCSLL